MSALTMSPHLLALFKQNLMNQSMGMGILGGRRKKGSKCPKGTRKRKVSFSACRKGKGIILGGCECCMGQGCSNCMGMGMLGGRKRNDWISCLKKLHSRKKCQSQRKKGYPVLMKKSKSKKRVGAKKKLSPGLKDFQQILKELRRNNPGVNFRSLQKEASNIYQSGNY